MAKKGQRTKYSAKFNPGSCDDERGKCKFFDKCWTRKDGGLRFIERAPGAKCREPVRE